MRDFWRRSVFPRMCMTDAFENILDTLEKNPFLFPVENDHAILSGYRKALFSKWYKAVFSVDGEKRSLSRCRFGLPAKPTLVVYQQIPAALVELLHLRYRHLFPFCRTS